MTFTGVVSSALLGRFVSFSNLNESNTMFQINDKVVCVDNDGWYYDRLPVPPQKGPVYVVEYVVPQGTSGQRNTERLGLTRYCLMLVGVEGEWHPARFRKLSDIQAENAAKRAEVRKA